MASKHSIGLVSVEVGDIAPDGGPATVWEVIGETVAGSASLTTGDPTIQDFNIEESDSPVESIITVAGKTNIVWSSWDVSGPQLEKYVGGTYDTGTRTWDMPDQFPEIEKSLRLTDKKGNVYLAPRVKFNNKINFAFKKDDMGKIDFNATIMQPTKAGVPRFSKIDAA